MRPRSPLYGQQILVLVACLCAASPAPAAPGEADALRAALQAVIDARQSAQAARGGALTLNGAMTIVPASGGGHAVTLPKMELRSRDGDRVVLGAVKLLARASTTGRGWEIDATLPSPIRSYDGEGKPEAELSLGTQRLRGLLDPELKEFTAVHIALGNMELRSPERREEARIATLRYDLDLAPGASGSWSGPGLGVATGIRLTDPKDNTSLTLDSLSFETNCRECTGAVARALVLAPLEHGWGSAPDGGVVPQGRGAALVDLVRQCRFLSGRYALNGLTLVSPRKRGSQEMLRVGIRDAVFVGEVTTTGSDSLLDGAVRYRMTGMSGLPERETGGPSLVSEFFPRTTTFEATFRDVDPRRWNRAGAPDSAGAASGARDALIAPGTVYELKEFSLGAAGYDALLTGVLSGDDAAPLGIQLDMTLACTGVDESLGRLRGLAMTPGLDTAREKELALAIQALGFIEMLGRRDTAPDGRSRRSFHLVVDGKGEVLLNGSDVKSLLEMMGGPKPDGK